MRLLPKNRWFRYISLFLALTACIYAIVLPPTLSIAASAPLRLGRVDLLWSAPESGNGTDEQYISGSVQRKGGRDVNVAVAPTTGKVAPYVEYADPVGGQSLSGKRWVLGSAQKVKGGFGPMAALFGGKEPAGRKVVELGQDNPAEFKLVLVGLDQTKGTAKYEAFVRACVTGLFSKKWLTCSPYSIPTGFVITLHETQVMPVDAGVPQFGFSLSNAAKAAIKQAKNGYEPTAPPPVADPVAVAVQGITSTTVSSRIAASAQQFYGVSSANGPGGGNEACAFMVNKVVFAATGKTIGQYPDAVLSVDEALRNGAGVAVSQQQAQPGDIVIAKHQEHIGICMNVGCSSVLSNSSSRAAFVWKSDPNFGGYYDKWGGSSQIYHVK